MSNNIDYDFISVLDDGQHLEGYVPAENQSKSGVTIATGFDLGEVSKKAVLLKKVL